MNLLLLIKYSLYLSTIIIWKTQRVHNNDDDDNNKNKENVLLSQTKFCKRNL